MEKGTELIMKPRYMTPGSFVASRVRISKTGRRYWLLRDKKEFCELYINRDWSLLNMWEKMTVDVYLFANRNVRLFTDTGLPVWDFTDEPVKLKIDGLE